MSSYLGSKGQKTAKKHILGLMPPHAIYIEGFVGTGEIYKTKEPAQQSILIDKQICQLDTSKLTSNTEVITGCFFEFIKNAEQSVFNRSTFIYLDPPYHPATRSSHKKYNHELTEDDHALLLDIANNVNSNIMLSGYRNDINGEPIAIYKDKLQSWFSIDYPVMTRDGLRTETLWCNFEPAKQHNIGVFIGNKDANQRTKRKINSLVGKFSQLSENEKRLAFALLAEKL